jgi:hypothetical protein
MESLLVMFGNYKTTLGGFALGVLYYLSQLGPTLPKDNAGWLHLVVAAVMAGVGLAAKDATTGSKPQ